MKFSATVIVKMEQLYMDGLKNINCGIPAQNTFMNTYHSLYQLKLLAHDDGVTKQRKIEMTEMKNDNTNNRGKTDDSYN